MKRINIIVLFIFTITLKANFSDTYGISSKAASKGNAVVSNVDDWSSIFYNVSGLGRAKFKNKKSEIAINYLYTKPFFDLNIDKDIPSLDNSSFGITTLAFVWDIENLINLPDEISTFRFGLTLGTFQDGAIIKINDMDFRNHNFLRYGREVSQSKLSLGLGMGFLDDMFGLGFGVTIITDGKGTFLVEDLELSSETQVTHQQVQIDLVPTMHPNVGLYFSYKDLNIGFNYRHELEMNLNLHTDASMRVAGVDLALEIYIYDYYSPTILTLGTSYSIFGLELSFDLEYQMWSQFSISRAAKEFIKIYNHDNSTDIKKPKMSDIFVPKIGLSYSINDNISTSAGYFFRPSFLTKNVNKDVFNFLDSNTHVLSLGASFIIPKNFILISNLEANISTQMQFLEKSTVTKDNEFLSEKNPEYSYSAKVFSVFLEIIFSF